LGGIKNGAHNPTMDRLIQAFQEKENIYQEVRRIMESFAHK
jgi:hypothetical protein